LLRFPVNRVVAVRSPLCTQPVHLDASGADPVASLFFWRGLTGWEPETIPVFLRLVTPDSVVLDIGAHTGIYSLLAARRSCTATIHAIEPVPRVFALLEANVARNKALNVQCHRLAFAEEEKVTQLYVPRQPFPMMTSMLPGWREDSEAIEMSTLTVDSFVAQLEIDRVDVIKLDTEGTEALVLKGAECVLRESQPFVFCEVLLVGNTAKKLGSLFTKAGYSSFLLAEDGVRRIEQVIGSEAEGCRNVLFVPESRWIAAQSLLGSLLS
jgi:FkbM family methyltransferase